MTTEGESKTWTFPSDSGTPPTFRSCDSEGITYHFCPDCGSTVYWEFAFAPDFTGVAVGAFTDPTVPPPMISGFEAYGHPWALTASELPLPGGHHDSRWATDVAFHPSRVMSSSPEAHTLVASTARLAEDLS